MAQNESFVTAIDIVNVVVDGNIIQVKIKKTYVKGVLASKIYLDKNDKYFEFNFPVEDNDEGYCEIMYHDDGKTPSQKQWWLNNRPNRNNGPSQIIYDKDGNLSCHKWYKNGWLHNDNGPAIVEYYPPSEGGKVKAEYWYKNGALHKDGKSPIIVYNEDGTVKATYENFNDKNKNIPFPIRKTLLDKIKDFNDEDIQKLIRFADLLKD